MLWQMTAFTISGWKVRFTVSLSITAEVIRTKLKPQSSYTNVGARLMCHTAYMVSADIVKA